MKDAYRYTDPRDPENEVTVLARDEGGLHISVADEHAMDSYNATFECGINLNKTEAIRLRNYLIRKFPL